MYALTSTFMAIGVFCFVFALLCSTYLNENKRVMPVGRWRALAAGSLVSCALGLSLPVIGLGLAIG